MKKKHHLFVNHELSTFLRTHFPDHLEIGDWPGKQTNHLTYWIQETVDWLEKEKKSELRKEKERNKGGKEIVRQRDPGINETVDINRRKGKRPTDRGRGRGNK